MIPLVIVVFDEGFDLVSKVRRIEVVLQQNAVLQGLVPPLDLTLGLWVIGCAPNMIHALIAQPFGQFTRYIAGAVVAEQTWFVDNMNLITTRCLQSQFQRVGNIFSSHVRAELPGDDVTAVVVQNCAEIEPAPTDYLQVSEVCLPKLVNGRGLILELVGGLDHDESRAGDQIMGFQDPIDRRF